MGRIKITDNEQTITNDVFIDLAYQEEISVAKHILQIDPDYIKLLGFIPTGYASRLIPTSMSAWKTRRA